jgi:hypothetical protein
MDRLDRPQGRPERCIRFPGDELRLPGCPTRTLVCGSKSKDKILFPKHITAHTRNRDIAPNMLNKGNTGESVQLQAPEKKTLETTEQEALKHDCPHLFTLRITSVTVRWFVGQKCENNKW